ncbi:MAG: GIY-YIG nuclease family protein [Anaerolineaceae bacterium]|nr:GIY-YIG nuclease family protein [Anaerolineaceae bacterium]
MTKGTWTKEERRRIEDHRPHSIYRFDHPAGVYCYIGLTADLEERIRRHCLEPDGQLYDFLSRYRSSPGDAQQHFRVIDRAMGFRQAEERETAHILSALLEACDAGGPVPRNKRTHQIDPDSFGKIAAIAVRARAAQGIVEDSRRADEAMKQCRAENEQLLRLRERAERKTNLYQVLCVLLLLGLVTVLAFGTG